MQCFIYHSIGKNTLNSNIKSVLHKVTPIIIYHFNANFMLNTNMYSFIQLDPLIAHFTPFTGFPLDIFVNNFCSKTI